ncbi:hypothetical protein ZIOFF_008932 [Zingiber officinale]|uniref:Uncharacterized protein n=1 Tax=Zingiber officinale TaxID=94328 RepID=A0A8J5LR44_ZINOF|nr:hypothetical protein ZIOFF_008932 [Zingiber officinale]
MYLIFGGLVDGRRVLGVDGNLQEYQKNLQEVRSAVGTLLVHAMPEKEIREDDFLNMDTIMSHSQKLEEELQKLGLKIKHHEDNLKFLKAQIDGIDESILDLQVELGQYHSRALETENSIVSPEKSENHTLPLTKDVLGVVATLGKVHDDNLSRPYVGEFIPEDLQRRLALLKPRLANGETPPEFIGFAVNMTDLDRMHLAYITPNGLGLRVSLPSLPNATSSMLCPFLVYLPPVATNPGQGRKAFIGSQPKPGTVVIPP